MNALAMLAHINFTTQDAVYTILFLALCGFVLWLMLKYIPMQPPFPQIIIAVVVLVIILWLLSRLGMI